MSISNIKNKIQNIITKLKLISNKSTDKELSKILHVDGSTLSSWKHQSKQIPIDYLIDFCDRYDVSLDYILREFPEDEVKEGAIKLPYYKDYDFSSTIDYITTRKPSFIKREQDNIRAIRVLSSEMPRSAPKDSIMFIDFDDDKVKETPNIYLIQANENYFLREVSITPQLNYFLSSENERINSLTVEFQEIEILGRLIGVTKWQD